MNVTWEIVLYRFYDEDGHLLYVGITNNFQRRLAEHEETKSWFGLIHHHEIVPFPTRSLALDAEEAAIWEENPIYNIDRPLPDRARPDARSLETEPLHSSVLGLLESWI